MPTRGLLYIPGDNHLVARDRWMGASLVLDGRILYVRPFFTRMVFLAFSR
jgi:hypothetical protein